jgi:hypothetical protein
MNDATVSPPEIWGTASMDDLNALARFYFPSDGKGPRQPRTNFCQVEAETLRVLIELAMAYRLSSKVAVRP